MLSPSGMILAAASTGATKVLSAPIRAKTTVEVRMNILACGWTGRIFESSWRTRAVFLAVLIQQFPAPIDPGPPGLYFHIVAVCRGVPPFLGNHHPNKTHTGFHPVDLAF